MELTSAVNTHFRTKGNEEKKGFYPTGPGNVDVTKSIIDFRYGWDSRSVDEKRICIFDPCAGEGAFLSSMVRHARKAGRASSAKNTVAVSYGVELDTERFAKVHADQKLNSSFFEVTTNGDFDLMLLNPPYNKNGKELLNWVKKAAPMVTHRGVMVLIIPKNELDAEMIKFLRGSFSFRYAYLAEDFKLYHQVLIFLTNAQNNDAGTYRSIYSPRVMLDNLEDSSENPIGKYGPGNYISLEVDARTNGSRPLLSSKDLGSFYVDCAARLDKAVRFALDKEYPSNFDTSIQPASTLRVAHAVQLASMNSQIESVEINGAHYLAKYMLIQKAETFEAYNEETDSKTTTTIHKPTVETFLMDTSGVKKTAKEWGFDYLELNSQLSTILLRKLTKMYQPLHEIGTDEDFLAKELEPIGLKAPQREAVKAVIKAFKEGRKGMAVRGSTGSGKTYIAKSIKYLAGAKRSIMTTEPQLVPQLVKEYENEGFKTYVIDSWESLQELAKTRPKGLYLLAYTRLRMHPNHVPVFCEKKVKTSEGRKFATACCNCNAEIEEKVRKGDKKFCPVCGEALFTYVPENQRAPVNFKRWSKLVEQGVHFVDKWPRKEAWGGVDWDEESQSLVTVRAKSQNKQLPYIRALKRMKFDLLLADEAHNAANLMSNQGTAFIRLASSARQVLCLTATVTNGMAKSLYNLLWGINPQQMRDSGWDMKSATEFQTKLGAFKEVRKSDEDNRHRESEKVTTYDTAGISPAALVYTLPNVVNVDAEDFDDLPPVEREVIKCQPHPEVEVCMREIENIIEKANLPQEDKLPVASVRNAAFLRVSDTFRHAADELTLRDTVLGTLKCKPLDELLEKEERLVEIVQGVVDRGERVLILTGNTQKIDMRGPLKRILAKYVSGITIDVLPDSVSSEKLVKWFESAMGQVAIVSFHRVATGLNLSQYNNLIWYDYVRLEVA